MSAAQLASEAGRHQWTAQNIELAPGVFTIPGTPVFIETDARLLAMRRALPRFLPKPWTGLRGADLGSLEGAFALAFARDGMEMTGYEARRSNMAKCELVARCAGLPNLRFEHLDVKEFRRDRHGEFDLVLALGILYHLDQPVEWIRQIAEATRRVCVIDTHFAPGTDAELARIDPRIAQLSRIEEVRVGGQTYHGRWFTESAPGADPEWNAWASFSNHRSFWLTKESLLRAILDAGFELLFEQHDYSARQYDHFQYLFPRTLLIAAKP